MTRTKLQNPYSNIEYISQSGKNKASIGEELPSSYDNNNIMVASVQPTPEPELPELKPESRVESVLSQHSEQLNIPCEASTNSAGSPSSQRMASSQSPLDSRPPTNISAS